MTATKHLHMTLESHPHADVDESARHVHVRLPYHATTAALVSSQRYRVTFRQQKGNYQWWRMATVVIFIDATTSDGVAFHGVDQFGTFDINTADIINVERMT